jgi:hypothetical protein
MLELHQWMFKLRNPHLEARWPHWDVFDPDTQRQVGEVRTQPINVTFKQFFRFVWLNPPVEAHAAADDSLAFSLCTPFRLSRRQRQVRNASGELVGSFRQKWFSIRGGHWLFDHQDRPWGEVRADWSRYEFQLLGLAGQELGRVSRKLVGLPRAFLYNERDYLVTAADGVAEDTKRLLLATVFAVCDLRG